MALPLEVRGRKGAGEWVGEGCGGCPAVVVGRVTFSLQGVVWAKGGGGERAGGIMPLLGCAHGVGDVA